MAFSITRSIGVDYGHRVMTHGSKCRSIHGHRGTIEVTCAGSALHQSSQLNGRIELSNAHLRVGPLVTNVAEVWDQGGESLGEN